jgi:hypothetical protein
MVLNLSLNRVTFSSFSALPLEMRSCLAHQWLATWGIAQRMRDDLVLENLPALPAEMTAERLKICGQYAMTLNDLVDARDASALAFADKLGIALAALIATLKLAPLDARKARMDWDAAHWDKWGAVQTIVLGGGLFSGALGKHMYNSALEWLPKFGAFNLELILPDQPRLLMLRGAARAFESGTVCVLDAGHTAIKRGIAQVENSQVVELIPEPMLEIPFEIINPTDLLKFLVNAMSEIVEKPARVQQFSVSISVFLDAKGNVLAGSSSFYSLLLEFALIQELESRLADSLGYLCVVKIMHEAKAAMNSFDDADAAILLGTSVGGGFRG